MEQKTILLNGGRVLDVAPAEGADEFLIRLLGAAPSKPAVPTLRVIDNTDGQRCVGVFIGGRHVGFLSQAADPELVATLQACDLHGAVARARGNLVPSWDRPGKVTVKVNLAESAWLLGDPIVEPPGQTTPEQPATFTAAPLLESSLEEAAPSPLAASLEDATPPELSAGYEEDYPDWPPRKPEPPQSTPSPQALSPTGSAWLGAPAEAAQTGWLAAPREASQARWHEVQPAPGQPGAPDAESVPPGQSEFWQDRAERAGGAEGESATGWTSGTSVARPANQAKPAKTPSRAKTWIISALAILVLATTGFVVWKTVFAAKTYTDSEYGYSFSYPGGWELADNADQFTSFSGIAGSSVMLDGAAAGRGDKQSPQDFAGVGVAVFDTSALGLVDPSQRGARLQIGLTQAASPESGMAIVEPVSATTVGGINGYQATITLTSGSFSVNTSFCFLIDGNLGYMALAMAPESDWSENQKAFDDFFRSFKPGSAGM